MKARTVTIKQLHERTGSIVRQAARESVCVTDRGAVIAVIAHPSMVVTRGRRRSILPEYAALLRREPTDNVLADLDAVRRK